VDNEENNYFTFYLINDDFYNKISVYTFTYISTYFNKIISFTNKISNERNAHSLTFTTRREDILRYSNVGRIILICNELWN